MEENQKITCTVNSCKYNSGVDRKCKLSEITVTPMENCNTKKADESMCSSYKYEQ